MPDDVWVGLGLEDLFPSKKKALDVLALDLAKKKHEADLIIQSFDQKLEAASQGIAVTSNLLTQIGETGYNILMMPPKSEGFFPRVANSDNQPYPDEFSAGVCIFFQAPSITLTAQKYKALIDIITSA